MDESSVPPLPGASAGSLKEGAPLKDLRKELRDRALAVRSHFRVKQQAKAKACVKRIAKLLAASASSAAPASTQPADEPGSQVQQVLQGAEGAPGAEGTQ